MGAFKSAVITEQGLALLSKVGNSTTQLNFTNIKTSSEPLTGDLASMTNIGTIKQMADTISVKHQNDASIKISAGFSNANLTVGYYVRNIGLYAMDPQEGEILYSISVADESNGTADWMPPFNGIGISSLMVDLITSVHSTSDVNITVDPTQVATVAQIVDLQEQVDDLKTHLRYEGEDVYGVEIDFASKTITRVSGAKGLTEGANFDSLAPWGGRKRCILANNGVRLAYYGETGYTESGKLTEAITVDGVEYPIGASVQVMVEQPLFYVKAVPIQTANATSGNGKQYVKGAFYISPTPKRGFSAPRAFYDDEGVLQDKIYLSAYEGCIQTLNADMSDGRYVLDDTVSVVDMNASYFRLASVANAKPASGGSNTELSRDIARHVARMRGDGWKLHNIFAMAVTQWLFMIEYASLDPQRKVGQGVCNLTNNGSTNIAVVTGATASIGNGSGIPDGGEDGKCSVTYRGEENLWGNMETWLDCVNIPANGSNYVWVTKIGTTPIDNKVAGYYRLSAPASFKNGFSSAFGIDENCPEILIPTEANGSDTFADYITQNHSTPDDIDMFGATFGGMWADGSKCGFSLTLARVPYDYDYRFGARSLYVPQSNV